MSKFLLAVRSSYLFSASLLVCLAVLCVCQGRNAYAQTAGGQAPTAEQQRILQRADASTASAESTQNAKRVALVIGNAEYQQGRLSNPVNDARAIATRLRGLGFEVVFYENLKTRDIGAMYREFRSRIVPGGVALVFYAGHGLQFRGQNYFPAVDSDINGEEDVPLQSVNLGTLLDNMEEAKAGVSLVFLDACRDNPFARRFRSASRGLAKIEVASGTLIHYATKPGSVASDGDSANGTYTEALLAQMDEPGVPVELMLKRVANRVVSKTRGKQEPWMEGSLRGDFYFIFKGPVTVQVQAPAPDVDPENQTWSAALRANTLSAYQAYLDAFPRGRYAVAAKIASDSLRQPASPTAASATPASPVRNPSSTTAPTATAAVDDAETALWNAVEASSSADDYGVYLKQYPKGRYAALAQQRLKKLDADAKARADAQEQEVWQEAERAQTAEGYQAYSQRYPRGKFASLAQTRAKKLAADAQIKADALAWDQARSANTADTYADYLSRFPSGRFVALAKTAQQRLQREAKANPKAEPTKVERDKREMVPREELDLWGKAETATDIAAVQRYLDRYPTGAHAAQANARLAELKRAQLASAVGTARRGDVIGTLQVKDGWTGVLSNSMDVRVVQATADRTVYSSGDIVGRDGSVQQLRVGNVVLQVVSGALWTLPIQANASGSAKVQVGAEANLQGSIKWTVSPSAAGRGQVAADVEYLSNANSANHAVIVLGKWTANYDGRHPLPESEVVKIRGGTAGLVATEITNMSSSSFEWADPAYAGNTVGANARNAAGGPRGVEGTLVLRDGYTGVVSSNMDVRVVKATAGETIYSSGDVIGADGSVQRLRVGNVALQVVSGALWTVPINASGSGSAKVQVGNDASLRGTIKWTTEKMDSGKWQVKADIEYLSNANSANRSVIVQGKWSAVYSGTSPLAESDVSKLKGGTAGLVSTEVTNVFNGVLDLH